jgi:regulator of G-protein signaling
MSEITLQAVLSDPELVLLFRSYLKDNLSSENLAFIVEIENFKEYWNRESNLSLKKKRVQEIYNKYFNVDSKYELNVPGNILQDVIEKMQEPNGETFNRVEESVFKLIEADTFPRFVKCENYLNFTKKAEGIYYFR